MLNEYVYWRNMRIHVQVRGRGEPLLLINGLGANTDMWESFAAEFSDRKIILFDAPGTGRKFTRKTLQLNFWRPGDTVDPHEEEIRYGCRIDPDEAEQKVIFSEYGIDKPLDYIWLYR